MLMGILLTLIILVCVALIGVILLQRSEGGVMGMGGGGTGAFMTARGTGDLLTATTQVLAGIFFVLCLIMTMVSGHNRAVSSIADQLKIKAINPVAASSAPAAPANANTAPTSIPLTQAPTSQAPAQSAPANPLDPFAGMQGHTAAARPLQPALAAPRPVAAKPHAARPEAASPPPAPAPAAPSGQ